MPRTPFPSRTYPKPRIYRSGPWVGMRDAVEPSAADPRYAKLLRNCYATSTEGGVRCVQGIPGFVQAGTQLGSGGTRVVQWIGTLRQTDGTIKNLAFCNGVLSSYSFSGDAFTEELSQAEIAAGTGSPSLSTSARIYALTYSDQLIVSDETNVPFQWDGTNSGGVVELSNAPVFRGQPVIYYEKLTAIKDAEPDTWVWSEEGDPTIGYDTAPYENAWNFGGTKAESLVALAARNESLGLLRPRSTTVVEGATSADFRTTATRPSVSEELGTTSPAGVLVLDEGTMTVDADGRPQFWPRGGGYSKNPYLWEACENTVQGMARTLIDDIQIVADGGTGLIWVIFAGSGASTLNSALLFERTGGLPNFVGIVTGFPSTRWGVWVDDDGRERLVHAGADDGYVYVHGTAENGPWNFALNAGTQAISHEVAPAHLGADIDEEKHYDEFSFEALLPTSLDVTLSYETPYGTSTTPQNISLTTSGAEWDVDDWDVGEWAGGDGSNKRARAGINEHGRWMLPTIRHAVIDQEFCIIQCQAVAFTATRDPEVE